MMNIKLLTYVNYDIIHKLATANNLLKEASYNGSIAHYK